MKKEYNKPELTTIELDQLDVITTSGVDDILQGGLVGKSESFWSHNY